MPSFGSTQLVAMRTNLDLTVLDDRAPVFFYLFSEVVSWTVHYLLCIIACLLNRLSFQVSVGPVAQRIEFV